MTPEQTMYFLKSNNVNSLKQLASMSWLECILWDNCGIGTVRELRELLNSEGLKFKHDDSLQAWLERDPSRYPNRKLAASLKKPVTPVPEKVTLRDQYAMAALTGLLANPKLQEHILKTGGSMGGWIEESAWSWAGAMMEQRK
jgi:hypothetical protein